MTDVFYSPSRRRIVSMADIKAGRFVGVELHEYHTAPLYARILWKLTHLFAQ